MQYISMHLSTVAPRFVFKVVLVANGNFKANHVKQQSDNDVWLMDGAGMSPNCDEYFTFLASAIQQFIVHLCAIACATADADADYCTIYYLQKAPCENSFNAIQ